MSAASSSTSLGAFAQIAQVATATTTARASERWSETCCKTDNYCKEHERQQSHIDDADNAPAIEPDVSAPADGLNS